MVAFFADSNRATIYYIAEADNAWGVTPTTGVVRQLRFTGSTLNADKTTAISEEIRGDRMVPDVIETGFSSKGEFNVEFSAGSHDDFMQGFMFGAWTRPMTYDLANGEGVQWGTDAILYINGVDLHEYFTVGCRIRTDGFINPVNNDYFQISAIDYNAGADRTEITVTTTVAVPETGSAFTIVTDANDVIVLKNTAIRAGTAGAATFDSNGGNAFAAAIAAGQLSSFQNVYIDGLGYDNGTVTFADPVTHTVAAGATVTVTDGVNSATFQFGGSLVPGNIPVVASSTSGAEATTASNLALAINQQRPSGALKVSATSAAGVVTIKNLNTTGGTITKAGDTNTAITIGAFAGGDATQHGMYQLQSATDDVLTVSPAPSTNANAGSLSVTIKGSMLRNPGNPVDIVKHSFSMETGFEDVSQYFLTDGLRIGTMQYTFSAGEILKGSYGVQGAAMTRSITSVLEGEAYTVLSSTATPVANATVNVGQILLNGEELSTALKSISIQGTNNLRDQLAVGSKFPVGIGAGRIEFTGAVEAYFADGTLFDIFLNHSLLSLSFPVTDVNGNQYKFTLPAVRFTTDTVNPAAGNQDVMENMNWTAIRDSITDCTIQIDRFSNNAPVASVS